MKLKILLIGAALLTLAIPQAAWAQSSDKDCADFDTQREAQAYFESIGGSPSNNADRLDADGDGVACERKSGGTTTTSGGKEGTSTLPMTGSTERLLLFAGISLLAVGASFVLFTRRHA